MRTTTIDFPFFHKEVGKEVIVEVEVMLYKGIKNPASDWDARDFIEILTKDVYLDGEAISVDIPDDVIYSVISSQIRDAQVWENFYEEDGEF